MINVKINSSCCSLHKIDELFKFDETKLWPSKNELIEFCIFGPFYSD